MSKASQDVCARSLQLWALHEPPAHYIPQRPPMTHPEHFIKQTLTFGLGSESKESIQPEAQVALGPASTIYPEPLECQAAPSAPLLHPAIDLGWQLSKHVTLLPS